MLEIIVIVAAGFVCGSLNAVAGGGTFVTLPALIWLGMPPVVANATATTMAVPGYCASAWAYRRDIRAEGTLPLTWIIGWTAAGGVAGAILFVVTSADAFARLVPWLLLSATLLFACAPSLLSASERYGLRMGSPAIAALMLTLVAIYGGYFNGGLGIVMLAALSLQGFRDLHGMNGLKNLLSSILSIVSVAAFTTAGLIAWDATVPMAVANIVGGYVTARFVRRSERTDLLRYGIICMGATMTAVFFIA